MLRAGKVGLRARDEADVAVLHAELYEDIATYMIADSRPWRPLSAGSPASPYAIGEPGDDVALFSVVELARGELAGAALLWAIDVHNRSAHLGLSLRPSFRGRGLGSDVVLALCEYGFTVRGLHRLQVDTLASNAAMIRAAERAGFTLEGTLRGAGWVNGDFADEVILGLLAGDWAGGRLPGPQQAAFEDHGHGQLTVSVLVEQHRDLVAVVALHRALAPALAHTRVPTANGTSAGRGQPRDPVREVVVAVPALTGVVLPEVGEQERAPAAGVLGVAAHHRQPRALDLVLAFGLRLRRLPAPPRRSSSRPSGPRRPPARSRAPRSVSRTSAAVCCRPARPAGACWPAASAAATSATAPAATPRAVR